MLQEVIVEINEELQKDGLVVYKLLETSVNLRINGDNCFTSERNTFSNKFLIGESAKYREEILSKPLDNLLQLFRSDLDNLILQNRSDKYTLYSFTSNVAAMLEPYILINKFINLSSEDDLLLAKDLFINNKNRIDISASDVDYALFTGRTYQKVNQIRHKIIDQEGSIKLKLPSIGTIICNGNLSISDWKEISSANVSSLPVLIEYIRGVYLTGNELVSNDYKEYYIYSLLPILSLVRDNISTRELETIAVNHFDSERTVFTSEINTSYYKLFMESLIENFCKKDIEKELKIDLLNGKIHRDNYFINKSLIETYATFFDLSSYDLRSILTAK